MKVQNYRTWIRYPATNNRKYKNTWALRTLSKFKTQRAWRSHNKNQGGLADNPIIPVKSLLIVKKNIFFEP